MLNATRALAGIGVGIVSPVVPTYISESSPKHIRGRLTGMYQLFLVSVSSYVERRGVAETTHCSLGLRHCGLVLGELRPLQILRRRPNARIDMEASISNPNYSRYRASLQHDPSAGKPPMVSGARAFRRNAACPG